MPPFATDVRKSVPLPRIPPGLLHGVYSIEIKYFQEDVLRKHFNHYPPWPLSGAAWASNGKL
jgi:hypothetical protein